MKLDVGDLVYKPKGYSFIGEVVAAFTKKDGQERYVVENKDTMLHIFGPTQLRKMPVAMAAGYRMREMSGIGGVFQRLGAEDSDEDKKPEEGQDR